MNGILSSAPSPSSVARISGRGPDLDDVARTQRPFSAQIFQRSQLSLIKQR